LHSENSISSRCRLSINPSLAFSFQQFSLQQFFPFPFSIFPSTILFPSKSFPHQKAQSKNFFPIFKGKKLTKAKSQAKIPEAQMTKVKPQKAKGPLAPSGVFYGSKQGGTTGRGMTLQQQKPVSWNSEHNLGETAVLPFCFSWPGAVSISA
jgi:hypothetical protein